MPTAPAPPVLTPSSAKGNGTREGTAPLPAGRTHRRSALLLVLTLSVASLAAVAPSPRPVAAATATTTTGLNLRSGPGTTYAVILVMPSGAAVEVVGGPQNGFYQVVYNGTAGWASGDFLSQGGGGNDGGSDGGGSGSAVVTSDLNLRAGPSTGDRVLAVMPAGATVTLTGNSSNGFLSVTYNGIAGWAYAAYLDTGGGTAPAPTPPPAPAPSPNPGGSGTATVTTSLNLRAGPSTGHAVLTVMPAGATVTLTGNSADGFLSVRYGGVDGWAYASYLDTGGGAPAPNPSPSPMPAPAPGPGGSATVTANLNLRSGPGTSYGVITVMPAGAVVTLTGNSANGFLSVRYNGTDGWGYADYLSTGGNTPAPSPSPSPSPSPGGSSAVTTTALNLRAGPSTGDAVLTVMPTGSTVAVTGAPQNGFHPVSYAGRSGWAYSSYLSFGTGSTPGPAPGPAPGGGSGIVWPFASGGAWQVIQGYNGGTHQNRSPSAQYYYALDFARVGGNTAGQPIYSPVSGTVRWTHAASGGIAIDMGNGYILAMFHCTFLSSLGPGQAVQQGQYLGTISGPGGPGYASTPHLDMTLWRSSDGGYTRSAAPFTGANAISGVSFPDVGGYNQHYGTVVYP